MNKKLSLSLGLMIITVSNVSLAGQCTQDSGPVFLTNDSKAFETQYNRKTWEDWIWRGPVFKCPTTGTNNCTYMWGQSQTTGYSWGVGVTLNLDKIPVIGGALSLIGVNGKYDRQQSYTTNYSWNVQMSPGYFAQPIQVVNRRWVTGKYRGATVRNYSKKCAQPSLTFYEWDGNAVAGRWNANVEVSRYATYNIHK
ncbi:hypothetical protein [Rosenbergiella nectarea]|uniref:hypothetical protein n=1 Tax=Rosenbergiella nectarea TaxID=988801 RepID=UPI001F4D9CAF|nr:hypothetical protein [Rosenbergiella nectarea]